jgi:hypothetical protein
MRHLLNLQESEFSGQPILVPAVVHNDKNQADRYRLFSISRFSGRTGTKMFLQLAGKENLAIICSEETLYLLARQSNIKDKGLPLCPVSLHSFSPRVPP